MNADRHIEKREGERKLHSDKQTENSIRERETQADTEGLRHTRYEEREIGALRNDRRIEMRKRQKERKR